MADPSFSWKRYNKELMDVKNIALITNVIHSFNWFLGFCALTWATTVILGGIITDITELDYYFVVILLLLEAARLACARVVGFSVTKHIVYGSADPTTLDYKDCRNLVITERLRIVGQFVTLIVMLISIAIPIRALRSIHYPENSSGDNFRMVEISLRVFYIIVLANGIIGAFGVLYARTVVYFYISPESHSLRKYYDTIVWNGVNKGLFESAGFDILQFAFQVQADEYRHNKRAPMVMYVYECLMLYLYDHPNHKGFEAAKIALDSEDVFVREAAANIVGCWVKLREQNRLNGIDSLLFQEKLLSKLASALEHEETGRAASYSFVVLGEASSKDPENQEQQENLELIANVRSESGQKLAEILMRRVHEVVKKRKFDKAVLFIRALIPIIRPEIIDSGVQELTALHADLANIIRSPRALKRTKAVAATALYKMYTTQPLSNALDNVSLPPDDIIDWLMRDPGTERDDKQHILEEEWKFFKDAVDDFKARPDCVRHMDLRLTYFSLPEPLPVHLHNSPPHEVPDNLRYNWNHQKIKLRHIPPRNRLPWWLKNIKTTSCIIAVIMLVVLIGGGIAGIYFIP